MFVLAAVLAFSLGRVVLTRPLSWNGGARAWWTRTRPLVKAYVVAAPATFTWLLILFVTTAVVVSSGPQVGKLLLLQRSTNLHQLLGRNPWRGLVQSAFFVGSWGQWLVLLPFVVLIAAPVERWLGTRRWLVVAAIGHVGVSIAVAAVLYAGLKAGVFPASVRDEVDVGASYVYLAMAGVLSYRWPAPWRAWWVGLGATVLIAGLLVGRDYAQLGHVLCFATGLACWPLTRGRPAPSGRGSWRWAVRGVYDPRPPAPAGNGVTAD